MDTPLARIWNDGACAFLVKDRQKVSCQASTFDAVGLMNSKLATCLETWRDNTRDLPEETELLKHTSDYAPLRKDYPNLVRMRTSCKQTGGCS